MKVGMVETWVVSFSSELGVQCVDVNSRNYRWSESRGKVWQTCDTAEDETVEHDMILECAKYTDRMEMMRVIQTNMGCEVDEVTERNASELIVLLLTAETKDLKDPWLRLCQDTSAREIDAMKDFPQ